jgi:hypothetical protein
MAGVDQYLVYLLGGAIVARVLRIAEAIGKTVERPGSGDSFIALAPIHNVHQVGLNPPFDDLPMQPETLELVRVFHDLVDEVLDRQFPLLPETARKSVVRDPLKETEKDSVHLDVLEINVADLGQPELAVTLEQWHQATSLSRVISSLPSD